MQLTDTLHELLSIDPSIYQWNTSKYTDLMPYKGSPDVLATDCHYLLLIMVKRDLISYMYCVTNV